MTEFDGLEFYMGSVFGARAWKVDKHGNLTGIHYKQIWSRAENIATCLEGQSNMNVPYYKTSKDIPAYVLPYLQRPEHSMEECQTTSTIPGHGFYAYYDTSADFPYGNRFASSQQNKFGIVQGVIEGYGEVWLGEKGFRCMKAQIVALCIERTATALTKKTTEQDTLEEMAKLVSFRYWGIPMYKDFQLMLSEHPLGEVDL